jgi:hypothetical protein
MMMGIFIVEYWIDKYVMFRFSSKFHEMNFFMSQTIEKIFEGSLLIFVLGKLLYNLGNCFFRQQLYHSDFMKNSLD